MKKDLELSFKAMIRSGVFGQVCYLTQTKVADLHGTWDVDGEHSQYDGQLKVYPRNEAKRDAWKEAK